MPRKALARISCAAPLDASEGTPLPVEFRIFAVGVNATSKGPLLYDDEAAALVWERYTREGVDLCIDLNHGVLDESRPDSGDARGWFKLAQREGELWAVEVRWTPDGERRLREKTQRYISPLAMFDEETTRVTGLLNVALVSMPAMHGALPLVAASAMPASLEETRTAVQAVLQDMFPPAHDCAGPWVVDLYGDRAVFEKDGELFSVGYVYADGVATLAGEVVRVRRTYEPIAETISLAARLQACESVLVALAKAASNGASNQMDPKQIQAALEAIEAGDAAKALELLKAIVASAAGAAGETPAPESEAAPLAEGAEAPPEDDENKTAAAAMGVLQKLVGTNSPGETVAVLSGVVRDVAKIKADAAVVELDSRRSLIGDLVKLGAETPATAWEGDPSKRMPCKRLAAEPIGDLRARVVALKALPGRMLAAVEPPEGDVSEEVAKLSPEVLAACSKRGITPEQFLASKKAAVRRA